MLILAAALAAFSNSFSGPFVFDDQLSIPGNPTIRSLATAWSPPAGSGMTVAGRPLLNFSFALNWAISGERVWSYHALNFAIHAATALLLCGLVRITLSRLSHSGSRTIAIGAALLWSVHPLGTAAVTYIVQRAESLAALWIVLALYAFARGVDSPRGGLWRSTAVLAAFAGVATKETAVVIPLLALLYDRAFLAGSFATALRARGWLHAGLAASWILLAVLVAQAGDRGGSAGFGATAVLPYALQQAEAVTTYLRLAIWPSPLVFDYGTPLVAHAGDVAGRLAIVTALLLATAITLWRAPRAGFLAAAFFVLLAPSSSIVPVATQTMAEHRAYLPLATITVAAALLLWRLVPRGALPAACAIATLFGVLTHQRNATYRDEVALWRDTAAKLPSNPRAHHNLGFALARRGDLAGAVDGYRRALELRPDYPDAQNNLGNALAGLGNLDEAHAVLARAAQASPGDPELRNSLGNVLFLRGDSHAAARELREAVRLAPDFALARSNLGQALAATGDPAGSLAELEAAVRLAPEQTAFRNNLANHLAALGRTREAEEQFMIALSRVPDDALSRFNYGCLLQRTGRLDQAAREFSAALAARADYVEAHVNLAAVLQQLGRINEAISHYEAALRLRPGDPLATENLRRLRGSSGP